MIKIITFSGADGKIQIDEKAFEIPADYTVDRENVSNMAAHRRPRGEGADPEMEEAINESLREMGWAQDPETRRQIIHSQRQVQHELNSRLDEEQALQEAIKRSLSSGDL